MQPRQIVNPEKLAEAQEAADAAVEAADAAMEAAKLAAEKVAEVRGGDDSAREVVNLEKPAKAQEADGGGTADGYRIIQDGPESFSVEGFFRQGGSQRFRSAKEFPSEAAARQWVYDQLAAETGDGPEIVNLEKPAEASDHG
jgi:hypothetical protein